MQAGAGLANSSCRSSTSSPTSSATGSMFSSWTLRNIQKSPLSWQSKGKHLLSSSGDGSARQMSLHLSPCTSYVLRPPTSTDCHRSNVSRRYKQTSNSLFCQGREAALPHGGRPRRRAARGGYRIRPLRRASPLFCQAGRPRTVIPPHPIPSPVNPPVPTTPQQLQPTSSVNKGTNAS